MTPVLDQPVLVLNRYWQPVHCCSVRRCLHLLCTGNCQIVQVEGDECYRAHDFGSWLEYSDAMPGGERVHGTRISLLVPRVLVLTSYDRLPRLEVKFTRRNVFLRDHFTCQYCEAVLPESKLNLDHVHPRDKGGRTTWDNIVTSCFRCNTRKANKLPHEIGMHPRSKPYAPNWRPLYGIPEGTGQHSSWDLFLKPMRDSA